jgi:hypothetical protein
VFNLREEEREGRIEREKKRDGVGEGKEEEGDEGERRETGFSFLSFV